MDPNLFIAKLNDTFNDFNTSVDESAVVQFSVFPDPASDVITLRGLDGGSRVSITDALGRVIHTATGNATVNISTWPNGVYHLCTRTVSTVGATRLVVEH